MYIDRYGNMTTKRISICTWLGLFLRSAIPSSEKKTKDNIKVFKPPKCGPKG